MSEEFLKPQKILDQLELREDMTAADFGSGSGGWVLPLAEKLAEGKVYAVDILEEPLAVLKSKKVPNVETILADVEREVPLPAESCDLVLMTNLLFECQDKERVFREALRVLKKGGKILVVDWRQETPVGPAGGRVPDQEPKRIAESFGLKLEKEFEAGVYHYGLIFNKINQ